MKLKVSPLTFVFAAVMLGVGRGIYLVSYLVAVVMHEMVHAEVARRRGYILIEMKIMPYGASLTGRFEGANPKDECIIALAGPIGNACIAVVFTAVWWLAPATYFFTEIFVLANLFTALTNLLPVFPLDGGRALLALLSMRFPRQKAYKAVRSLGFAAFAAFVVLFVLSIIYGVNFTFALMAVFVLASTVIPDKNSKYQRLYGMAYRSERIRHGLVVRESLVSTAHTLRELSKMLGGNYYSRFSVVDERMDTVATFTESDLEGYLVSYPPDTAIGKIIGKGDQKG